MGREPDEVALQRGPDGRKPSSSRDCKHTTLLVGIGAAGGDTAGREPEHRNRPGRVGPAGPATRTRLSRRNPPRTIHHRLSCKTGCRTAKLDEPTRNYGTRIARRSSPLAWMDQERLRYAKKNTGRYSRTSRPPAGSQRAAIRRLGTGRAGSGRARTQARASSGAGATQAGRRRGCHDSRRRKAKTGRSTQSQMTRAGRSGRPPCRIVYDQRCPTIRAPGCAPPGPAQSIATRSIRQSARGRSSSPHSHATATQGRT